MKDIDLENPVVAERYNEAIDNYFILFGENPPTIEAPIHWDSLEWLELVEDCICEGQEMTLDYHQLGEDV